MLDVKEYELINICSPFILFTKSTYKDYINTRDYSNRGCIADYKNNYQANNRRSRGAATSNKQ